MKVLKSKSKALQLRQHAEAKLSGVPSILDASLYEAAILKLVHELQVHQIELEMQNDELEQTKDLSNAASEKYAELYDFSPAGYFTLLRDGKIFELNLSGAKMLGKTRLELKNNHFGFFVADNSKQHFSAFIERVFNNQIKETVELELIGNPKSGLCAQLTAVIAENGVHCMVTVADITKARYLYALETLEREVLEMSVGNTSNMEVIINHYLIGLEKLHPGLYASFLEKRGDRLFVLAAPNLPISYTAIIEAEIISESSKVPCHTAAFLKQAVLIKNIRQESSYAQFAEVANHYNFKACWAIPILDNNKNLVAVFSNYYNQVKLPEPLEINAVEKAGNILQLLYENHRKETIIKENEERLQKLVNGIQVGILLHNPTTEIILSNPKAFDLLGLDKDQLLGKTSFDPAWNVIREDGTDFPGHEHPVSTAISSKKSIKKVVMGVYRPKTKDRVWLLVDAVPLLNQNGDVYQVICSFINITNLKNAEQNLQKSEALLKETEQMGNIGGWEFDVKTLKQSWTDQTFKILEIDTSVGEPTLPEGMNYILPEYREMANEAIFKAIEGGTPFNQEWEVITEKGNKRWLHVSSKPSKENGSSKKIHGSFQDITIRKKSEIALKLSEERYKGLLNNLDAGIIVHGADTSIIHNNSKASILLGLSDEQLKSKLANDPEWKFLMEDQTVMPLNKYPINQILSSKKSIKNYVIGVYRLGTKDVVWLMVNGFAVLNEQKEVYEVVMSIIDITDQKEAEEKLRKSNAELEQFAYVASHDLQEPLRMVASFLTLIEKKYGNSLDDAGKNYINIAVDGAKRMQQIIQDLLDYSRVGNAGHTAEKLDLNQMVKEIESLYQQQITEKNATITIGSLPAVFGYKVPVRQVFQNLIGNALKYNHQNVAVHISITAEELQDQWKFSIQDNGIGISKKDYKKIFLIFQRLHTKEEYAGTGIGLAITQKVVESMGGEIWVESKEGSGSTFYFTLRK